MFAIYRRMDPVIDTSGSASEIAERVREELDYEREAKHVALYAHDAERRDHVRVPGVGRICPPAAC